MLIIITYCCLELVEYRTFEKRVYLPGDWRLLLPPGRLRRRYQLLHLTTRQVPGKGRDMNARRCNLILSSK